MAIKRYTAIKDNTITNAYESNLTTRGTGSNMGLADSLEVFSIYAQESSTSNEQCKFIVQFPVTADDAGTTIISDRNNNNIPASGSVNFYLRVFDVAHTQTTPRDFTLVVSPISQSWQEGYGLDMENYSDQTYNGTGSNWINASSVEGYGSSTITIVDYTIITGTPDGVEIIITTTDGTTITAIGGTGTTTTTDTVDPTFNATTSNTNAATNLATCLNANSKLSATSLGAVVTVTQVVGGLAGNTAVTRLYASGSVSLTDFTGGSGGVWTNVVRDTLEGGSFLSASWMGAASDDYNEFNYTQDFGTGTGDLEVNITGLVEQWIVGSDSTGYDNYGVGVMLTSSQASGSRSFYTKKFSARGSEYFFKRPIIEARWDDSRKDNRGNFYVSSSNMNSADNLNTLYLYNYVRGQPTDLPNLGDAREIFVRIYTSSSMGEVIPAVGSGSFEYLNAVTGGWVATGIYSASFALNTTASFVYDRWFTGSEGASIDATNSRVFHTGSFTPIPFNSSNIYSIPRYVTTITNLQPEYYRGDNTRLRLFTRLKDWSPTIYTVASKEIENKYVENAYYKIYREGDGLNVIAYGTGSNKYTQLSYDGSGSYFDLNISLLESDYSYAIKFLYYINGAYEEQPEIFRFRVKE